MVEVENTQHIEVPVNPLDSVSPLKAPPLEPGREEAHPPQAPYPEDSSVTKAEKFERHGVATRELGAEGFEQSPAKRIKLDGDNGEVSTVSNADAPERQKGVAPIKSA